MDPEIALVPSKTYPPGELTHFADPGTDNAGTVAHFIDPGTDTPSEAGQTARHFLESEPVTFLETPKRKPCALSGGHRYLFSKRNCYDICFWRCEKYFKEKCKGGIATNGTSVIKTTPHVCRPDPSRVDIVRALHICRRRAREDTHMPISRIVAEEFTPLRDRGVENVPSYLSLKSSLHRERQKHLATRPDPGDFLLIEAWILNSKRFDLLNKDPAYLYANCIICSTHFEDTQFTSSQKNRLLDMAVPTKFPIGAPTGGNELLDSVGDEICMEVEAQMQAISPSTVKKGMKLKDNTPMISTSIFSESKALLSTKTVTFSSKPRIITTQIPASRIQNSNIVTFANGSAKQMTSVGSKDQPKLFFLTKLPQALATKTPPPSPGVTVVPPSPTMRGKPITPGTDSSVSILPDNPEIETKYKIPGTSDTANDEFGSTADYSYSGGFDGSQFGSSVLQDSTNSVDESYDNTYDTSYNEACGPPSAKRKRPSKPAPPPEARRVGRNHSNSAENLSDNYQAFSELVVAQLKALPPNRAAILQMKIQCLLSKTIAGSEEDEDGAEEEALGDEDNEMNIETTVKSDTEADSDRGEKSPRHARSEDYPSQAETQVETTTTTTMVTTIAKKKSLRQDGGTENKENQQVVLDNVYIAFSKCIVSQLKYLPAPVAMKTQNRIQKVISEEIVRFHNTRPGSGHTHSKADDTPVNSPPAVQIKEEPEDSCED